MRLFHAKRCIHYRQLELHRAPWLCAAWRSAPIGMPATIRSLNKYTLQPNYSLGFDVQKGTERPLGIAKHGIHLENKGMEIDASVQ